MIPSPELPVLVVPAAGVGSRLKASTPKFLAPVAGQPMLDHLLHRYAPYVSRLVLVVSPSSTDTATTFLRERAPMPFEVCVQESPTGMLDAVLQAHAGVAATTARRVWVTWCDQVGILDATLARLAASPYADAALALPTITCPAPYIHFDRDASGRIVRVRQRREGDPMPDIGESDAGLFGLSRRAFLDALPEFARSANPAAATRERNLLPFVPWLAMRNEVRTFPCEHPMEAIGVNTPEEQRLMESWLLGRIAS